MAIEARLALAVVVQIELEGYFGVERRGRRLAHSGLTPTVEAARSPPRGRRSLGLLRGDVGPSSCPSSLDFGHEPRPLRKLGVAVERRLGTREGAFGGVRVERTGCV